MRRRIILTDEQLDELMSNRISRMKPIVDEINRQWEKQAARKGLKEVISLFESDPELQREIKTLLESTK